MKNLIACCGLDCETCDARVATLNNDNALREKTAKLWSGLNEVPITPDMINCLGCRTVGAVWNSNSEVKSRLLERDR